MAVPMPDRDERLSVFPHRGGYLESWFSVESRYKREYRTTNKNVQTWLATMVENGELIEVRCSSTGTFHHGSVIGYLNSEGKLLSSTSDNEAFKSWERRWLGLPSNLDEFVQARSDEKRSRQRARQAEDEAEQELAFVIKPKLKDVLQRLQARFVDDSTEIRVRATEHPGFMLTNFSLEVTEVSDVRDVDLDTLITVLRAGLDVLDEGR